MGKIRVAVLRGGPSSEYDVSLKTGGNVLRHLEKHDKYSPQDILISKDGRWHIAGMPAEPDRIIRNSDVVFNALHGEYGEDGKVQQILDSFAIPYTGSGSFPSAVGMNKVMSKKAFKIYGIRTPLHAVLNESFLDKERLLEFFRSFPQPCVIKPVSAGSSVGVSVVYTFADLEPAIVSALRYSPQAMAEEFIEGKEATCGVVDHFRGHEIYSLLPIEIRKPKGKKLFDFDAKYGGGTQEICPGNFSSEEKEQLQRAAAQAHKALGLRHYSRSDFIVTKRRGIYILETNSLPGLTNESLLPKSLKAVGCEMPHFLDHLITLALQGK